jgi:proteic killer suppression protein
MIASFKDGQLRKFWKGEPPRKVIKGISPEDADRIEILLTALDAATMPDDLEPLGLGYHPLRGDRKGQYAMTIRANWRIVFEWEDGNAVRVRQEDYHGR